MPLLEVRQLAIAYGDAPAVWQSAWRVKATIFNHVLRREGMARDVLHGRDGALGHERDRHRMGTHAVARDAAAAWEALKKPGGGS